MRCPFCHRQPVLKGSVLKTDGYTLECRSAFDHSISVYGNTPELTYAAWVKALMPLRPWWMFWRTK